MSRRRCPCCFGIITKQTEIIEFIRDNPGMRKQEIIDNVYGPGWNIASKTIDVTINHANNRVLRHFGLRIIGRRSGGYAMIYTQTGQTVGEKQIVRL